MIELAAVGDFADEEMEVDEDGDEEEEERFNFADTFDVVDNLFNDFA